MPRKTDRSRSTLETDEPTDERVVPRVRAIAVGGLEQAVEPLLGLGKRHLDREPETAQSRRADRDEQRLDRLGPAVEVSEPSTHKIFTRKDRGSLRNAHAGTVAALAPGPAVEICRTLGTDCP